MTKATNLRLKNRGKLEKAQELGFDMTEFVDGLLAKYGDKHLADMAQKRIEEMQKVLAAR